MKTQQTRKSENKQTFAQEAIAKRAYELYLERGKEPGGELQDWLMAERELMPARGEHKAEALR